MMALIKLDCRSYLRMEGGKFLYTLKEMVVQPSSRSLLAVIGLLDQKRPMTVTLF